MPWKQSMDGSDAVVDLLQTVRDSSRLDGWTDEQYPLPEDYGEAAWGQIAWQHGPIQEVGRNGILIEELIELVILPRLQGFNRDRIPMPDSWVWDERQLGKSVFALPDGTWEITNPFRTRENSLAITAFEEGLLWLKRRHELRKRQGVEGTFKAVKS